METSNKLQSAEAQRLITAIKAQKCYKALETLRKTAEQHNQAQAEGAYYMAITFLKTWFGEEIAAGMLAQGFGTDLPTQIKAEKTGAFYGGYDLEAQSKGVSTPVNPELVRNIPTQAVIAASNEHEAVNINKAA